jgi:hypothetical protein
MVFFISLKSNETIGRKSLRSVAVSNLKFEYNSIKTDILILFPNTLFQHNHNSRCQKGICSSNFDGKGNVLAHGFFPNNNECLGIHFDKSENWYFGESSNTPDGQTNFYTVLLHEIGHTLGIEHSANNNSIMYAYYNGGINKLTQDDIWAIQYLYGRPERLKYELIPTTTTVKSTVRKVWQRVPEGDYDSAGQPRGEAEVEDTFGNLCDFNKEIHKFLIANNKYVWLVNLKDMTYDKEPKLITDYLYFLLDDFQEISHIYQRPSGDVLIVVKHLYYLIDFPSFNADIMVNLLKILEYRKEKELMQYLELILEKHIQCGNYLWNKFSNFKTNDTRRKR